jgi:DNA-binding transcriptional MerR regulator/predicted transcriptional regulator YdeE
MDKKNLLSIGDVSKQTGASIRALHYYEKNRILTPAYIDPFTKYRYYSVDQLYLVEMIRLCIELGISTKELKGFINENKLIDYVGLLKYGQKIAREKINRFQQGFDLITDVLDKVASEQRTSEKIYTASYPKKYFRIAQCPKSFSEISDYEVIAFTKEIEYFMGDFSSLLYSELILEYGFLIKCQNGKVQRYFFMEVPASDAQKNPAAILEIPEGSYFVADGKVNESQIEGTPQRFKNKLEPGSDYLAIETNIYTSVYKANKPTKLRVIAMGY